MIVASKRTQRVTNFALAALLVVSTITASVPFIFSQKAEALGASITTSSYASISDAIAAADNGDTVLVDKSETISTSIAIHKSITIKGDGGTLSVPITSGAVDALSIQADNVTVDGVTFVGTYTFGNNDAATRAVAVSPGVQNAVIENNSISNLRQPAYLGVSSNGTVTNNYTTGTKGWVVSSSSDYDFSGNTWGENVLDIAVISGTTAEGVYNDAKIVQLSDNNNDATVEKQPGTTPLLSDAYVTTTSNGRSGDVGSKWNPTTSIQAALDRVVVGGTVHIADGVYNDTAVAVNKATIIKGVQAGIDARSRSGNETVLNAATGAAANITVNASNVTIDGLTLKGPTGDTAAINMLGAYTNEKVQNNIINDKSRAVVFNTSDTTFLKNRVNNADTTAYISGFEENNTAANNVVIDSNDFYGGNKNGDVNFIGSGSTTSTGLEIKGNKSVGGKALVGLYNTTGASIHDNTVTTAADASFGLFIGGKNVGTRINSNTISNTNAAGAGLLVLTAAFGPNSDIKGASNNFSGSVNGAVVYPTAFASTTENADLRNNWWGNASGPLDTDATDGSQPASNAGTGVVAGGRVNYGSWCVTADCSVYSDATLDAPTLITPENNTYTTNPAFVNTWTAVTGAGGYEYRTSHTLTAGELTTPYLHTDTTVTAASRYSTAGNIVSRQNDTTTPQGDYYWQVRTLNAAGQPGPWSTISKVTVDSIAPTKPVLALPSNGSTVNTNEFDFDWNNATDATALTYEFHSSQDPSRGTDDVLNGSNVWTSGTLPTSMMHSTGAPDGYWYYQVRAKDAAGNYGPWSDIWSVYLDTVAPTAPVADAPAGLNKTATAFTWTAATDASNVLKYEVITGTSIHDLDADGKLTDGVVVKGTGITGTTLPSTFTDGTFYWQVRATDGAGHTSPWSNIQAVTLDATKPSTPTLVAPTPTGNAILGTGAFLLDWSNSTDATSGVAYYEYQAANDPAVVEGELVNPIYKTIDHQGQLTDSNVQASGTAEGTYYWQVRAIDKAGNVGNWSELGKVTVDTTAPSAPIVTATGIDSGAATKNGSVEALWTKPTTDTVTYDYKVWTDIATSAYKTEASAYIESGLTGNARTGAFTEGQGSYFIQVRAIDAAGNASPWSDTFTVIYDTTAPTVAITSPVTNAARGNNAQVTIDGTTGDAASYTLAIDGTTKASGTTGFTSYTWDTTGVTGSGPHTIKLTGTDAAGNTNSSTITMNIDNTGPDAAIDAQSITSTLPTITGTVGGDTDHVQVAIVDADDTVVETADAAYTPGDTAFTYTVQTPLDFDATYTVVARAFDTFGNFKDASSTMTIESAPIAVVTPAVATTGADNGAGAPAGNTATGAIVPTTPSITDTAAAAVLGATTDGTANNGTAAVKGASDDKTASALNSAANTGTAGGLAWYWWVAIIAGIAAIAWWIIAGVRRRAEDARF